MKSITPTRVLQVIDKHPGIIGCFLLSIAWALGQAMRNFFAAPFMTAYGISLGIHPEDWTRYSAAAWKSLGLASGLLLIGVLAESFISSRASSIKLSRHTWFAILLGGCLLAVYAVGEASRGQNGNFFEYSLGEVFLGYTIASFFTALWYIMFIPGWATITIGFFLVWGGLGLVFRRKYAAYEALLFFGTANLILFIYFWIHWLPKAGISFGH